MLEAWIEINCMSFWKKLKWNIAPANQVHRGRLTDLKQPLLVSVEQIVLTSASEVDWLTDHNIQQAIYLQESLSMHLREFINFEWTSNLKRCVLSIYSFYAYFA